jgi:cysteinyl-tRNA synthetase
MDILRRVLEDYFGYTTTFVMNVTDVDDKIIRRARLNHLLSQYLQQTPDTRKVQLLLLWRTITGAPHASTYACQAAPVPGLQSLKA